MAFDVPILFLVFNRPDTTARVFQRIKEIKPAKLFVAADGPRSAKEGEQAKCEEVRRLIIDGIDWPCEVKTLFRDHNLGCGHAVSGAITWFFDQVEEGIILEDDTLPDLSFFEFCKTLLEKYRGEERVKVIGGSNVSGRKELNHESYYFTAFCHIWGWATWRRVWKQYDFSLNNIRDNDVEGLLKKYFSGENIINKWKEYFFNVKVKGLDTWDYQLSFCIWKNNGVNIASKKNLVQNIGFGPGATHTVDTNSTFNNIPAETLNRIVHPSGIEINPIEDQYLVRETIGMKEKNLAGKIKDKLKQLLNR